MAQEQSVRQSRLHSFLSSLPSPPRPDFSAILEWSDYIGYLGRLLRQQYFEYTRIFPERANNNLLPWRLMEGENLQRLTSVVTKLLPAFEILLSVSIPFRIVLNSAVEPPQVAQIEASLRGELSAASIRVLAVTRVIVGYVDYLEGLRLVNCDAPAALLGQTVAEFHVLPS